MNLLPNKSYRCCEQKVIWQEFHLEHVVDLFDAMQLDALVVVDVGPLLLCDGKHVFGVKPSETEKKQI